MIVYKVTTAAGETFYEDRAAAVTFSRLHGVDVVPVLVLTKKVTDFISVIERK